MAPQISIVTLTWNSSRFIDPLLSTLLADREHSGIDTEVIVIDNGSKDDTVDKVQAYQNEHEGITVVQLGQNYGTTVSRNIGIRMARGEFIMILDSDTEMPLGTLKTLAGALDDIPDPDTVGIIHPRLTYPDGEFQESARRFPTLQTKAFRLLRLETLRRADETIETVVQGEMTPVDYAISACWLVPRRTFDRVGLLDEDIFYSPEDVEFCARVWREGLKVWYYPRATVIHNCQRLTSKKPFTKLGLSHTKGLLKFWYQYRFLVKRPDFG